MVDARLPDGSRVNAIIPPLSLSGPLLTIRKFSKQRLDLDDLVRLGTLSSEAVDFLERCVRAELNILISGGTGTGKTTLLNAMSTAIPDSRADRHDRGRRRAAAQPAPRPAARGAAEEHRGRGRDRDPRAGAQLAAHAARPDHRRRGPRRRGAGHAPGDEHRATTARCRTVHANSPRDALARIETMVLMAGYDLPVRAIRQQVASALDLIIHLERLKTAPGASPPITEVQRMESDVITLQDLFDFKVEDAVPARTIVGGLRDTGLRPTFIVEVRAPRRRAAGAACAEATGARRGAEAARPPMTRVSREDDRRRARRADGRRGRARDGVRGCARLTPLTSAKFPDRAFVLTLPSERPLAGADVEVLEDGEPVASPSLAPADRPGTTAFASRPRDRRQQDRCAATRSPARWPPPARSPAAASWSSASASIVFNKRAVTALPLTADQAEIDAALSSAPRLEGGTAIHDAALAGVDMLREARIAGGSVVLLSDGADTSKAAGPARRRRGGPPSRGPRLHRRARVRAPTGPRRWRRWRAATGGDYALASSPRSLDRHLRPARRDAQQPVPAPLPLLRPPARARDARGPRARRGAGDGDVHEPGARTRARRRPSSARCADALWLSPRGRRRSWPCWADCSSARSRCCCSGAAATGCSSG